MTSASEGKAAPPLSQPGAEERRRSPLDQLPPPANSNKPLTPFSIEDILSKPSGRKAPSTALLDKVAGSAGSPRNGVPAPASPLCALEELASKTFQGLEVNVLQAAEGKNPRAGGRARVAEPAGPASEEPGGGRSHRRFRKPPAKGHLSPERLLCRADRALSTWNTFPGRAAGKSDLAWAWDESPSGERKASGRPGVFSAAQREALLAASVAGRRKSAGGGGQSRSPKRELPLWTQEKRKRIVGRLQFLPHPRPLSPAVSLPLEN